MKTKWIAGIGLLAACVLTSARPAQAAVTLDETQKSVAVRLNLPDKLNIDGGNDESNEIKYDEIHSLQFTLEVKPGVVGPDEIRFEFAKAIQDDPGYKVKEFRYDDVNDHMTIYISGSNNLFEKHDLVFGEVVVKAAEGSGASVSVEANEASLNLKTVNAAYHMDEPKIDDVIVVGDKPEDPGPNTSGTPSGPGTSGTTGTTSPSGTPEPSGTPGATETPDVTETPIPSETPEPSPTPESPKTTVVENADGTKTETTVTTVKNEDGSTVKTTEVVNKTADDKITSSSIKTVITGGSQNKGISIVVNVTKNAKGTITSATAKVSGTSSGTQKALISGSVVKQITQTAGTKNVKVTVEKKNGSQTAKVLANASDLTVGKKLNIVIKKSNGTYVLVNAKTYTVTKAGDVNGSVTGNKTYELVTTSAMNTISKKILQTVNVKKTSKTVRKSKTVKMALKNTLNMENVKSIKYIVSKKSIVSVTNKGVVKGKKAGNAVVKAKVTLKNGKTKTVKMKVKVK